MKGYADVWARWGRERQNGAAQSSDRTLVSLRSGALITCDVGVTLSPGLGGLDAGLTTLLSEKENNLLLRNPDATAGSSEEGRGSKRAVLPIRSK